MKIKALKTLVGNYGRLNRGDTVELPNWQANQLLAQGYVVLANEVEDDEHKDKKAARSELHRGRLAKSKSRSNSRARA